MHEQYIGYTTWYEERAVYTLARYTFVGISEVFVSRLKLFVGVLLY